MPPRILPDRILYEWVGSVFADMSLLIHMLCIDHLLSLACRLLYTIAGPCASAILAMWLVLCVDHAGCLGHTSLARCGCFMWAGSRPVRSILEKLWQSGLRAVSLCSMGHMNMFCTMLVVVGRHRSRKVYYTRLVHGSNTLLQDSHRLEPTPC